MRNADEQRSIDADELRAIRLDRQKPIQSSRQRLSSSDSAFVSIQSAGITSNIPIESQLSRERQIKSQLNRECQVKSQLSRERQNATEYELIDGTLQVLQGGKFNGSTRADHGIVNDEMCVNKGIEMEVNVKIPQLPVGRIHAYPEATNEVRSKAVNQHREEAGVAGEGDGRRSRELVWSGTKGLTRGGSPRPVTIGTRQRGATSRMAIAQMAQKVCQSEFENQCRDKLNLKRSSRALNSEQSATLGKIGVKSKQNYPKNEIPEDKRFLKRTGLTPVVKSVNVVNECYNSVSSNADISSEVEREYANENIQSEVQKEGESPRRSPVFEVVSEGCRRIIDYGTKTISTVVRAMVGSPKPESDHGSGVHSNRSDEVQLVLKGAEAEGQRGAFVDVQRAAQGTALQSDTEYESSDREIEFGGPPQREIAADFPPNELRRAYINRDVDVANARLLIDFSQQMRGSLREEGASVASASHQQLNSPSIVASSRLREVDPSPRRELQQISDNRENVEHRRISHDHSVTPEFQHMQSSAADYGTISPVSSEDEGNRPASAARSVESYKSVSSRKSSDSSQWKANSADEEVAALSSITSPSTRVKSSVGQLESNSNRHERSIVRDRQGVESRYTQSVQDQQVEIEARIRRQILAEQDALRAELEAVRNQQVARERELLRAELETAQRREAIRKQEQQLAEKVERNKRQARREQEASRVELNAHEGQEAVREQEILIAEAKRQQLIREEQALRVELENKTRRLMEEERAFRAEIEARKKE